MKLAFDMNKCHFFNPETEQRLVLLEDDNKPVKKVAKKVE